MNFLSLLGGLAVPCIVCFVIGLVLLIVEMFIPGFGVCGTLGILAFLAVIVMQFMANSLAAAMIVTAIMLLLLTLMILLCLHSFQRGLLSRSPIVNHQSIEKQLPTDTSLVDKTGVALTTLRPTGLAEIEDRRLNVETAGEFIPAGTPIRVVQEGPLRILVQEQA